MGKDCCLKFILFPGWVRNWSDGVWHFLGFFCAALGICETLWSRGWVSLNLDVMLVFVRLSFESGENSKPINHSGVCDRMWDWNLLGSRFIAKWNVNNPNFIGDLIIQTKYGDLFLLISVIIRLKNINSIFWFHVQLTKKQE